MAQSSNTLNQKEKIHNIIIMSTVCFGNGIESGEGMAHGKTNTPLYPFEKGTIPRSVSKEAKKHSWAVKHKDTIKYCLNLINILPN